LPTEAYSLALSAVLCRVFERPGDRFRIIKPEHTLIQIESMGMLGDFM
jgi:hypothetical protein